jgi:transducin (beta)-like 1
MPIDQPVGPGPEQISSNVMNYLVWRYLQEAGTVPPICTRARASTHSAPCIGYDRAAHQLQRSWMGRGNRPDDLPFSPNVTKSTLVHLVQDGLYMDHLQAQVKEVRSAA